MKKNFVVVLDCDGVITDGTFYSTKDGKFIKRFGCDDWDALKILNKYAKIHFITADKKGFSIVEQRIRNEMNFPLDLVSHKPKERWDWIKSHYPEKDIVYIGDGIFDWYCLQQATVGITTCDALDHVQQCASYVIPRKGGDRFVAEACLYILKYYALCDINRLGLDE